MSILLSGTAGVAFWLVVMLLLIVAEVFTYELVSVWFAFGALVATIPAGLHAPVWVQLLIFLLASVASLLALRPILKKKVVPKKSPTNADRLLGQTGIVKEAIDNELATGRVHIGGLDWTARSETDSVTIPEGSRVIARRIEGVKMIVALAELVQK